VLLGLDAVGDRDAPERLDDGLAFLVGHGGLDQAGEAHGVGGFGLERLGLVAQRLRGGGIEAVALRDDVLDRLALGLGVVLVLAGEAHHER
jgi:hypothetical protein